ncbi:MAG: hypothetical protein VX533_02555 [Pseudomonadota bacterium]|nr:hypothetical protein [Pseudomonadota bacterium]
MLRYNEQPEAYAAAPEIYDCRKYRRALGKSDREARKTTIVKIQPMKIEFRDLAALREGSAALQVWEQDQTNII